MTVPLLTVSVLCLLSLTHGFSHNNIIDEPSDSIESPSNPVGTTTYKLRQASSSYCQARLDFNQFSLEQPVSGVCVYDSFTVSNFAGNDITLCGDNAGQHMYLLFNNEDDILIDVTVVSSSSSWFIAVTQITCTDSASLAPTGCLQYFSSATGTVSSFNYQQYDGIRTPQLSNMNYQVCFSTSTLYSRIDWTSLDFLVSGTSGSVVTSASSCISDYVSVSGGIGLFSGTAMTRTCGGAFEQQYSVTQPFVLGVITDSIESGDSFNNGFVLFFELS